MIGVREDGCKELLAVEDGYVYIGEQSGTIYRVYS